MMERKNWVLAVVMLMCWMVCAEASIVIRSLVVNPSSSQKRTVPFKSYLPKEVKPENIIDMGDLEAAYDPKEGTYYVFKDFVLEPKETVSIEIELEDVWKIAPEETASLREEAAQAAKILERTEYHDRASFLRNSIESKLNQIELTQKTANPNPGGYISDYRENIKLLESVKADLAAAKTLVAEAKKIAPMMTWKLIIAVVVFLGLLGLVFFIIWQRQIKSLAELAEDYAGPVPPRAGRRLRPQAEEGERRMAREEKKSELSDIEDRLKRTKDEG